MTPTIVQGIDPNSVIFDSEDTPIIVESNIGNTTYFHLQYNITNQNPIDQDWSRINDVRMEANTRRAFTERFVSSFSESVNTSMTHESDLILESDFQILERDRTTDAQQENYVSETFYVHKSLKRLTTQEKIDIASTLSLIATVPDNSLIDPAGVIRLPFFITNCSQDGDDYTATISDQLGNTLQTITQTIVNCGTHTLDVVLSSIDMTNVTEITITISGINSTIRKQYKIIDLKLYPIKKLVFLDKLGRYQYAYFIGQQTRDLKYERETYALQDDTYITTQVDEQEMIIINSGYLTTSQFKIVRMLANSPEIYLFRNQEYVRVTSETSKTILDEENTPFHQVDLKFKIHSTQD